MQTKIRKQAINIEIILIFIEQKNSMFSTSFRIKQNPQTEVWKSYRFLLNKKWNINHWKWYLKQNSKRKNVIFHKVRESNRCCCCFRCCFSSFVFFRSTHGTAEMFLNATMSARVYEMQIYNGKMVKLHRQQRCERKLEPRNAQNV